MVHHIDVHLDVSSCAVLTLHKDVLCCPNPQQVGSRQHLTAKQREEHHHEADRFSNHSYVHYTLYGYYALRVRKAGKGSSRLVELVISD